MNTSRFFSPNFSSSFTPLMANRYFPRGGRIGFFNGIINSIKRFNWSGLLNGANKTLNVVNQSIPLVRQAGPMIGNMKNMFKLAKAFGNETTKNNRGNSVSTNLKSHNINYSENSLGEQKKEVSDNNYPNFFV